MKPTTRIAGTGVYIPDRKVTNEEVLERLRSSSAGYLTGEELELLMEKARGQLAKAGNVTRYWCDEHQYCTDIARVAALRALEDAQVEPDEIDLIIFTGMSKAFVEPATAHVLRHEIGASRANVIDTQDACTSFMKSIHMADCLIQGGHYRTVLVAAGERTYDWADFTCKTVDELKWKFGSLTIGDGAGAVVLQPTDDPRYTENPKHMRFFFRLVDDTYAVCHIGLNHRLGERYRLCSHSPRLIRIGLEAIMELVAEMFGQKGWENLTYDNLFMHDIGKVVDGMVFPFLREAKVHIPDNYRSFFPEYGNVASVSLPLGMWLAREAGDLERGNFCIFACPSAGVQAGIMTFIY